MTWPDVAGRAGFRPAPHHWLRALLALGFLAIAGVKVMGGLPGVLPDPLLHAVVLVEVAAGVALLTPYWRFSCWTGVLIGLASAIPESVFAAAGRCGCLGGLERVPMLRLMVGATLGLVSVLALKSRGGAAAQVP